MKHLQKFKVFEYAAEDDLVNAKEWLNWASTQKDINPDLIRFIKNDKYWLFKENPKPIGGGAFSYKNYPTPRTWTNASLQEYYARDEDWNNELSEEEIFNIYKSNVGLEAATAFLDFIK